MGLIYDTKKARLTLALTFYCFEHCVGVIVDSPKLIVVVQVVLALLTFTLPIPSLASRTGASIPFLLWSVPTKYHTNESIVSSFSCPALIVFPSLVTITLG